MNSGTGSRKSLFGENKMCTETVQYYVALMKTRKQFLALKLVKSKSIAFDRKLSHFSGYQNFQTWSYVRRKRVNPSI